MDGLDRRRRPAADDGDGDGSDDDGDKDKPDVPEPWVIDRLQFKRDYAGYLDRRRTHLHVFDLESRETTQITSGDTDDSEPAWSPDGRRIAFVSNRTEEPDANYNTDIWLVESDNPDQGKTLVQVTRNPASDSSPRWHPLGDRLAYITATDASIGDYAQPKLALTGLDGKKPRVLSEGLDRTVRDVGFSSDGDSVWLLFEDCGAQHLAAYATAGGEPERLIGGDRQVRACAFGPDGMAVALVSESHMPGNLFAIGGDGALRQLTHHNDELLARIRLGEVTSLRYSSPDGTQVQSFIVTPPGFNPQLRYPTILWIAATRCWSCTRTSTTASICRATPRTCTNASLPGMASTLSRSKDKSQAGGEGARRAELYGRECTFLGDGGERVGEVFQV